MARLVFDSYIRNIIPADMGLPFVGGPGRSDRPEADFRYTAFSEVRLLLLPGVLP